MRLRGPLLCGVGVGAILASLLLSIGPAPADPISGTLFFTTFSGGENVHEVDFSFNGTSFSLGAIAGVASTNGADGLLFDPAGNLLIAGQGNNLTEITTSGVFVKNVAPGGGSFHLALTSNASDALVYNMGNGGCGDNCISAVQLSGGKLLNNGVLYTVTGGVSHDVRGVVFDPHNGKFYYGTAGDNGSGDFGTVVFDDVNHTATLTRLQADVFAHGVSFDPLTNTIIANSGNVIQQFAEDGTLVSTANGNGNSIFDQAAVDGKGHLFVASNNGDLEFIDYDTSGKIGDPGNFFANQHLADSLDDIAPLSGAGSRQSVPEPGTLAIFALGLVGLGLLRQRSAAS